MAKTKPLTPPTCIQPDVLYAREEVQKRMGVGEGKVRQAFREGLKSIPWGEKKYIMGRDLIDWLTRRNGMESGNGHE